MSSIVVGIIFLVVALIGVVLRKTYFALPLTELKRQARKRDPYAAELYRAAAYGNSLKTLLWLFIGLTSAVSLILIARAVPVWASVLIVGPLLWIVFSLVPATRTSKVGKLLTRMATPVIAWLLNYLHPILSRGADFVEQRYLPPEHTGLYERDDLIALIDKQKQQPNSRISKEELDILERTLRFDEYVVRDIVLLRTKIKTIQPDDVVGPVLIDEFHKSGQDYALVRDGKNGPIVGSLAFARLGIHSTGHVRDVMDTRVYYLNENDSLSSALHAFFVTDHPLFVVVNAFEEYIGIVTIERILQKLIGHVPGDDFDQYTDITAVAARYKDSNENNNNGETVKTESEVIE